MRLFVAVDIPGALRDAIESRVVEPLRPAAPDLRWTRPEGRHLTLKFLGEVADDRIEDVRDALRAAAASERSFSAAFDGIGGFPNLRRPRVLWLGVGQGGPEMGRLAAAVDRELSPLGFEPERRPFTAHLTLGRARVPASVGPLPDVAVPAEAFDVDAAVLFRSQLHPKGARYTVIETFPLR